MFFSKVGYVFSMVIVSMLPRAEFGPNDHQEDAPHFTFFIQLLNYEKMVQAIRQISFVHPDMSVLVHVCPNKLFLVSVRLNIEHSMKLIGRTSNQLLKITNKSINISEIFIETIIFLG